jgi:serine/threonine-protein kinase
VLYEVIAGRPPHTGTTAPEILTKIAASRPELPGGVPPELARICTRALHPAPAERFESVLELRLALQAYLEHRGSAELGQRAMERLEQLVATLAAPDVDREEIYRLFGACRFGFHEALAVWRDNRAARDGLARATIAVAEFELAADHPEAAVTMLGELDEPPPLLAKAKEAAAARAQRDAALERLRVAHDASIGKRTRTFLMVFFGLVFTAVPFSIGTWPGFFAMTNGKLVLWSAFGEVLTLLCALWARDTLSATLYNRRIATSAVFVFIAQTLLATGGWLADLDPKIPQLMMQFEWAVCSSLLTIMVDVWFWPSAVVYFAGFLLSARFPEARWYIAAGTNSALAINGIVRWIPDTLQMTPEERAWLDARIQQRKRR